MRKTIIVFSAAFFLFFSVNIPDSHARTTCEEQTWNGCLTTCGIAAPAEDRDCFDACYQGQCEGDCQDTCYQQAQWDFDGCMLECIYHYDGCLMSCNGDPVCQQQCDSYDEAKVCQVVDEGIKLLGGTPVFAKSGEEILLKPNVLFGSNPDRCISTHPSILKAVAKNLIVTGARVSYGDSSGFGKCEVNMEKAQLKSAGDELGLKIADFDKGRITSHRESLLVKQFTIANGVLDCDGLISLPKMKSHGLTRFTGAVKNQFGCVPGTFKDFS